MFRNYAITALRNLVRNKLYAGISIFGLAIGICAALLMSLILRNQLTYDTFIPGHERTYVGVMTASIPGQPLVHRPFIDSGFAAQSRLTFPQIEAATRIESRATTLRRGQIDMDEWFYWADPNVFDVLPLPAIAGDLKMALARPDGIVLTRNIAHKLFGRDDPVGETLQIITRNTPLPNPEDPTKPPIMVASGTYPMTVTAVIDDLPDNGTQLESGVFASGLAPFSDFNIYSRAFHATQYSPATTYLRLAPGASIDRLKAAMPAFMRSYFNPERFGLETWLPPNTTFAPYDFVRLDRVHLDPRLNPGIDGLLTMTALSGALILFIACINFVNLSTARSARRAREIGIRKVSGAQRRALIVQFLGESLIYTLIATAIAMVLTELVLPYLNATLDVSAVFNYWRDPMLVAGLGVAVLLLGVVAGLYPAFVLSAFRPATVLKGELAGSRQSNRLRQMLVTAQFAILIGLAIAAIVVYQQRVFATRDALRMDTDQVLFIGDMPPDQTCDGTLMTAWRALPGVGAAACGDFNFGGQSLSVRLRDGSSIDMYVDRTDTGLLNFYGLKPLAGRLFNSEDPCLAVVNEAAVRRLGYVSPAASIGQSLEFQKAPVCKGGPVQIIGVVPDVSLFSVERPVDPTIYVDEHDVPTSTHAHLRLTGRDIPETLAAIDRVWAETGQTETIGHSFINDVVQTRYLSVLREAQGFAVFSGVAVLLACLGLVGLAVSTAERRTKEIGIRKAMGANTGDVLRLLTWEFAKPVLWANLIAWPIAYVAMDRWLSGFLRHIGLSPWIFVATGGLALLIALATVSVQSVITARAKPVTALRYE